MAQLTHDIVSKMFGDYVYDTNPALFQQGYSDPAYWQAAFARRIADVDKSLAGNPFIVDYGGYGTPYKGVAYGGTGAHVNPEPYLEDKLGFNAPLGTWVWTKKTPIEKVEGSWNRNSNQDPENYGWKWVSAFDKDTMDLSVVPTDYRRSAEFSSGIVDGNSIVPTVFRGNRLSDLQVNIPGNFQRRENGTDSGVEEYWVDTTSVDGEGNYRTYTRDQLSAMFPQSSLFDEGGYINPWNASSGAYPDPAGRELTNLLSAAGYLPDKGAFSYGPRNWFEGFVQRNAPYIAAGIFTAATGGTMGPIVGAIAGAASQGAVTGQKTNDPWRIAAGAGAGAIGGAAAGGAFNLGPGASGLQQAAVNTAVGSTAGFANTYAQTGDLNASLTGAGYGALGGTLSSLAAPATKELGGILNTLGVTNPTVNEFIREGITSATAGGIMSAATGNNPLIGAAAAGLTSVLKNTFDQLWQAGGDAVDRFNKALVEGDEKTLQQLREEYDLGPNLDALKDSAKALEMSILGTQDPQFTKDLLTISNIGTPETLQAFNEIYGTNFTADDYGTMASYLGYADSDLLTTGDEKGTNLGNVPLPTTPTSPISNEAAKIVTGEVMKEVAPPATKPPVTPNTQQPIADTQQAPNLYEDFLKGYDNFYGSNQWDPKIIQTQPLDLGSGLGFITPQDPMMSMNMPSFNVTPMFGAQPIQQQPRNALSGIFGGQYGYN